MFRKPRKIGKRAFKIDPEATANRLPAFQHPRSFVSLDGHEILFGPDKEARRREIYDRAHGRCEMQSSPRCRGFVRWNNMGMEGWAHVCEAPHRDHCDCLDAGKAACDPCHRATHVAPRWSRKQAIEDFEKVMGGETRT